MYVGRVRPRPPQIYGHQAANLPSTSKGELLLQAM